MSRDIESGQKTFAELFVHYYRKARLSKTKLAKLAGVKDPKSLRGWESGKYTPNEENVYKLIDVFFKWGVMGSLDQAREFWRTACEERFYKGCGDDFDPQKISPSLDNPLDGKLRLIQLPQLSIVNPRLNEDITATFSLRNVGSKTVIIAEMAMCCRLGDTWEGDWADFPHIKNVRVKPSGEYHYQKQRSFSCTGSYFCEVVALIEGIDRWLGVAHDGDIHYPRIYFEVS